MPTLFPGGNPWWARILGDGAYYGASHFFVATVPNPAPGSAEAVFNSTVAHYRARAEHAFGRLWRHRLCRECYLGHDWAYFEVVLAVMAHLEAAVAKAQGPCPRLALLPPHRTAPASRLPLPLPWAVVVVVVAVVVVVVVVAAGW